MDPEQPTTDEPVPSPRRWAVPVAGAALVIIMVGVVGSVIYVGGDAGDTAASAATGSSSTTITAAPTGDTEPVNFVPGLGTLTWTQVEAPRPDLRDAWNPITFDPEHGYRWIHGPGEGVWDSVDGLTWAYRYMPGLVGDYRIDEVRDNGLAVADSADGRYLVARWTDDGWAEVADLSPITDTTGIMWTPRLGWLTSVADVVYSDVWLTGELPWGDIFGTFQRSTCRAKKCEQYGPKATWDEAAQMLHLVHPFSGKPVASVTVAIDGDTATFAGVATQQDVHVVVGTAGLPIEYIVGAIERETPTPRWYIRLDGSLVSTAGRSFEFSSPPWEVEAPRFEVPVAFAAPDGSGFVVYEQERGRTPDGQWPVIGGRTWTSKDALDWTEAAAQPFVYPWHGRLTFRSHPGAIVAQASLTDEAGFDRLVQLWDSSDGVTWTQRPVPPDDSVDSATLAWDLMGTEFGYVGFEFVSGQAMRGPFRVRYSVLADDDAWVEIVAPPDAPALSDDGAVFSRWTQAAGSLMYWADGDQSTSALWVGRFEP